MTQVKTGLDRWIENRFSIIKNKSVALLCHAASVDSNYNHIIPLMLECDVDLKVLFEPEHGVYGAMQDMERVNQKKEQKRGEFKRVSLYQGSFSSLFPKKEDLESIDVVVIDLQDVGSRYYTYVYTASFLISAASELGIPVYILDRPNPIGSKIEGNLVTPGFESFVGFYPYFRNRHSYTIGEMLRVIHRGSECDLNIVLMENYNHSYYFEETNAPWVLPSPNMPTVDTAILYPGGCLIEGTNISEGRGTTKPFHFIGAPWINPLLLKKAMESNGLDGVALRVVSFKPMFQKYGNEVCHGLELHITDRDSFLPLKTYLSLIYNAYQHFISFDWRRDEYEFVKEPIAIDLLFGTDDIRKDIEAGKEFDKIYQKLTPTLNDLKDVQSNYLYL
ncbi:DUF1343 domain-containing protein [bacterium]|nr:DUF1343 domain-containing protein [bacterium]